MKSLINRKIILALVITVTVIAILGVTFFAKANTTNPYVIEIVDEGQKAIAKNNQLQIEQKIIESESTDTDLVYELKLSNLLKREDNIELALVIDSSYSMSENTLKETINTKINALVTSILTNVPNIKISVSDNHGVRQALSNNASTITAAISSVIYGQGNSLKDGVEHGENSLSTQANTGRYVLIVTDSTDNIEESMIRLTDNNIKTISVLYDFTNNKMGTPEDSKYGSVHMIETLNNNDIINEINSNIPNVTLSNVLPSEILSYFDVTILQKGNNTTIETNEEGFSGEISCIKNNEPEVIKYKLAMKQNVKIDRNIIYKALNSSENISLNYKMYNLPKELTLQKENTPTFTICETYTLKIKAVNERNTSAEVEGVDFAIEGKDKNGNIVYQNTLTTDKYGYVTIKGIKTLDEVTYSIKPIVNKLGFDKTESRNIIIDNDYLGRRVLEAITDGLKYKVDDIERIVEVEMPIKVQSFKLEINTTELNKNDTRLSNIEMRLIQPKLNSKYEMDVLYGKTDENGQLVFNPAVMTKAGTYDYILSQMNEVTGYTSAGNVTIRLTFNSQGKITKTEVKYNDNVQLVDWNETHVKLNIGNENALGDTFNFELNLRDSKTAEPVVGAKYTVTVTTSKNEVFTYGNNVTDINGKINLKLPGSGEVHIAIVEEMPAMGYAKCSTVKEFNIHREDSEVKYAYGSNSSAKNHFEITCKTIEDKVVVDTESSLKSERNIVTIKASDIIEEPTLGLMNVGIELVNKVTGKSYGTVYTDENGEAIFEIDEETQGNYEFNAIINDIPYGYTNILDPIKFNIHFDENGFIDSVNDITDVQKIEYQLKEDSEQKLHVGYIEFALDMDSNLARYFEILLTDKDTNAPIEGATYNLEIQAGDFVKQIKGRPTNANGMISTRIAVDTSSINELTVTVQQMSTKIGYKADEGAQEITLILTNNNIVHTPEAVYPNNAGGQQVRYAELNGNTIRYNHTNRKKDISDLILNIHITTMDKTTDAVIGGVSVNAKNVPVVMQLPEGDITKEIKDSEGNTLDITKKTSITPPEVGYTSFEDLKVIGTSITNEQEYEVKMVVDQKLIRCKLTFSYNEYSEMIELVNVETIWGNRLIRYKNFSSYESEKGYESDVNLEIYANYPGYPDDVPGTGEELDKLKGLLRLDLTKADLENNNMLYGAKYDITIDRPDGTRIVKSNVEVNENDIELEEAYVTEGSIIYITEVKAPLGYEVNDTVSLKVTDVNENTKEVTLEKQPDSYNIPRAILEKEQTTVTKEEETLSCYKLNMYDVQYDKFQFKISTIDRETTKGVEGYQFEISNNQGSQKVSNSTNAEGESNTLVGGRYDEKSSPISYTITKVKTGTYYKPLENPITVQVYFKADRTVDTVATLAGQTDPNYSETGNALGQWHFEGTNSVDNKGQIIYDIAIVINVENLDPLKVEIETINKFTTKPVSNVMYQITPSVKEAIGSTNIDVSYAEAGAIRNYKMIQTVPDNYLSAKDLNFSITYDDEGNILQTPTTLSTDMKIVSYSGKTVKLQVQIEPRVPIAITNLNYFDQTEVLQGGEFKVIGMTSSVQTNSSGQAKAMLGTYGENEDITYTIQQTKARFGYAEVDPFDIIVSYGANREITNVRLAEPNNRFVTVSYIQPSNPTHYGYNFTDKGIIVLAISNYKAVSINIENVDRQNTSKYLAGTDYKVTSDINTTGSSTTDQNGQALTYVGKSGFDRTVHYTIEETKPSQGYQAFGTKIYLDVDFDANGYITSCNIVNNPDIANIATASKVTPIVTIDDNFKINIKLKNNPLMKINIKKVDANNEETVIKNVSFSVVGTLDDVEYTRDSVTTDQNGKATANIYKTLDSKTMLFTIKETKKSPFYEWIDDIKLEVSFDATGKMLQENAYRVVAGNEHVNITNVNPDNFQIDMTIDNEEIKAFGVHLYTDDVYDSNKKVGQATWDVYLTDKEQTGYVPDNGYRKTFITGRDDDKDGVPDLAYGEDFQIMGEHGGTAGTRILRLVTNNSWLPKQYYKDGNINNSVYSLSTYNILVSVEFDDEGKIVGNPKLITGNTTYIGWLLDERYVSVSKAGNYGINITVHYYPVLQFKIAAQDMYTNQNLYSTFRLSTSPSTGNTTYVKDGYIGYSGMYGIGRHWTTDYATGQNVYKSLSNIENQQPEFTETTSDGMTLYGRYLYLYEMNEPTIPVQYQKYRPRYMTHYDSRKIAKIKVLYKGLGELYSAEIVETYSKNNITNKAMIFDNIKLNIDRNTHSIDIGIKYAPITTISLKVQDAISKAPISGVKVYPYSSGVVTSTSYEYRTTLYYYTNRNGNANWTYWGANIADGKTIYNISLADIDKGYFGSSSSENTFRYIQVEVTYGQDGRIASAKVLNKDGFNNIAAIIDESCYGTTELKLTFELQRKLGMQINKQDKYNNNTNLSAKFKITNNMDTSGVAIEHIINTGSRKEQIAGRVIANNTIEYTLSEETVPDGYKPLDQNLKLIVKYRSDGTIQSAYPGNEYSSQNLRVDYICNTARKDNSLLEKDIEITILNEPKVAVQLELADKFYNNIKLDNVTFRMTNSEGDEAVGNLVTNSSGNIYTYIGAVYPDKTVTYTIEQQSKANGYYKLTNPITFKITFDNTGKPVDIPVLEGTYSQEYSSILTTDITKFRNDKTVNIRVYNMPETVNLGIKKYDGLNNNPLQNVQFKVTVEENGTIREINDILTDGNGNAVLQIDTFREEAEERNVIYTISEVQALDTYRKIQEFKIQVMYEEKGGIATWQVLSNESNLKYNVYKRGNTSIQKIGDTYAHIKLDVPNDNTYDLIIKDEDKNFRGLGIQGTKYDVSINGVIQNVNETDARGNIKLNNLTENGSIQIRIAEKVIGDGYRQNIENNIILEISKAATGPYTLALNTTLMNNYTISNTANSTAVEPEYRIDLTGNTYAIVSVNETYGQVKVTFYNETKSELTLIKQDINTNQNISNLEFKITAKNVNTNQETVLTESTLTDENGEIYFDLGVSPQNAIIEYTFEELAAPIPSTIYPNILSPQKVTVTYDMYGRISNITTSNNLRTSAFKEHNQNACGSIITIIRNGELDLESDPNNSGGPGIIVPKYTVKVVSEDVDTGRRINGSTFDLEVNSGDGNTLTLLPLSQDGTDLPNVTGNLCSDGKIHTDAEIEQGGLKILERGIIKTERISYEGDITINVSQTGFAYGYIPGMQKVIGQVKLTTTFLDNPNGTTDKLLKVDTIDNDGLEVVIDENTREIIITVKNESRVQLTIQKLNTYQKDDGTREPIKGASFTVTSQILTATSSQDTDLNVNTRETGIDGITSEPIGKVYPGKTVLYTIHENPLDGYDQIEDIEIAVVYDLKGNITYIELMSAYKDILNWTDIEASFIGTRDINIPVLNTPSKGEYKFILEKHDIDDGLYPDLLPGAEFEITVEEQFGQTKTWRAITNNEGKIISSYFNGYGVINVVIKEISAPIGYALDSVPKYITLFRDKDTGNIQKYSSDVNIDISTDNEIVTLKPVDKSAENTYGIIIDKTDVDTGEKIVADTAEFEVTITKVEEEKPEIPEEPTDPEEIPEESENGEEQMPSEEDLQSEENSNEGETTEDGEQEEITYKERLDTMITNEGRAILKSIESPEDEGTYIYTIKETKVPNGYEEHPDEVVFEITFARNTQGDMIIKSVKKISGEYAEVFAMKDQTVGFTIGNKSKDMVLEDDEYLLNIHKVDEEGNKIPKTAIFKVIMPDGETKYVETNEQGKLNLSQMKLPKEACEQEFIIQEIMAPEGYIINREPIKIKINFVQDENGQIVIEASNIVVVAPGNNVTSAELKDKVINIDIKNVLGSEPSDVDRGRYNIILTKIDADTKQIIPKETEITVTLENGQRILSRTKEDGKIKILEIKAPVKAGDYEYAIKETKAPEGYKLNDNLQIFKITFEEDANDPTKLVITNVQVVQDQQSTSILDVKSYNNNTVEIDVENEKDEDTLYLKSKLDNTNDVIYNVYQKEDLPAKLSYEIEHPTTANNPSAKLYRVDQPVIDTKTILDKASATYKGITVAEFIGNLDTNAEKVIIYDYEGKEVAETDIIKTEYKVKAIKGNQELNYTIVVKGDIDDGKKKNPGDGWLTNADATILKTVLGDKTTNKFNELSLFKKMAADIDSNGLLTNSDATKIKVKLQQK